MQVFQRKIVNYNFFHHSAIPVCRIPKILQRVARSSTTDVKEARADLKRAAEKLAMAHPDSESIKIGFTIAVMPKENR